MASITERKEVFSRVEIPWFLRSLEWIAEHKALLFLFSLAILNGVVFGVGFLPIARLWEFYQAPRLNLHTLPEGGVPGLARVILTFLTLGLIYWQGWRLARHLQGKTAWVIVLGGSLVSAIPLLLTYPFGASDIFDNILRGRILGVMAANPFLPVSSQYAADPFYPYIAWKGWPSAYGPGWEAAAGLAARLAGDGVIANVLAFKMLPGLYLVASLGLVALILREQAPSHALAGTLLLAWNPVVLYETWGNGHNDMAMVFWMLAAALALSKRRYTLAILALVAGALFKFIPVLLIPAALALALRRLPATRHRIAFLAATAFFSFILVVLAYAPFWEGIKVLNIYRRTHLYSSSLPAAFYRFLLDQSWSKESAAALVSEIALGLTLLFTLIKSWKVWKSPSVNVLIESAVQILLFYMLVTCLWFQNWYSLWLVGLVPLLAPGPTRRLALVVAFATLSKPFGIGPFLFWDGPRIAHPWLETWFTLGVLGLPWTYWFHSIWKNRRVGHA